MYRTEDQILIESRVANEKKSAGAAYFPVPYTQPTLPTK